MSLVLVKTFPALIDAELAKGLLLSAGIPALLQKDAIPGAMGFIQGAELLVEEKDYQRARAVLEQP